MSDDGGYKVMKLEQQLEISRKATEVLNKRYLELQAQVDRECVWTHGYDYEEETWESACGHTWVFMEGDCKDNNVIYCQGCGGKVVTAAIKGEES